MIRWYILDENHNPVAAEMLTAAVWMEYFDNRIVKQSLLNKRRRIKVSTVFLGLDHGYKENSPVLFETMIFGTSLNDYQERYRTWDEAIAGHGRALARARQSRWIKKPKRTSVKKNAKIN